MTTLIMFAKQNNGILYKHDAQENIDLRTCLLPGGQYPHVAAFDPNLHNVPSILLLDVATVFPSIVVIDVTIVSQYYTIAKSMTTSIMLAKQWQHQG